jgi:release factor glutamine methyltransferase
VSTPAVADTWAAAIARATDELAAAGCDTPRLDAELLLADAVGVTRASLYLSPATPLVPPAASRFEALVARRAEREPVAYILGSKPFRGLSIAVDPRVLIPRPETELLVEVGLTLAPGLSVADVGTGSGAVALALKDERPDLDVTGLDISRDAVAVAADNSRRLQLDVRFAQADLLDDGRYGAVLANPPYVVDGEALQPEIERYEPAQALFGGPDGLAVVRRLVAAVASTDAILLGLEVGARQADAVAELLARAGFERLERRLDLAGHQRVIVGRR